jgi:hypothetical protein
LLGRRLSVGAVLYRGRRLGLALRRSRVLLRRHCGSGLLRESGFRLGEQHRAGLIPGKKKVRTGGDGARCPKNRHKKGGNHETAYTDYAFFIQTIPL